MSGPDTEKCWGSCDYATRWMLIKTAFSRQIPKGEYRTESRKKKGERGIWQRRYWEHLIRDDRDYNHHVEYIHYNPVKHGHVKCAPGWQYSSIHRWGAGIDFTDNTSFGERE